MNSIPMMKNRNEDIAFINFFPLWSSGTRSDAAMYMNPPAAIGISVSVNVKVRDDKAYPIIPPSTAVSAVMKLKNSAFVFLYPPYTSIAKSPSS